MICYEHKDLLLIHIGWEAITAWLPFIYKINLINIDWPPKLLIFVLSKYIYANINNFFLPRAERIIFMYKIIIIGYLNLRTRKREYK